MLGRTRELRNKRKRKGKTHLTTSVVCVAEYPLMDMIASIVLFGVPKGIRVVKLCLGSPSTSTIIRYVARKRSFILVTRGFISVKVGKRFNNSSSSSWLGTSIVVVGCGCRFGIDPLGITTCSPIKWKGIVSTLDCLMTSINRGAIVVGVTTDFEAKPLNTHFPLLGWRNDSLKSFKQPFFAAFRENQPVSWQSCLFFFLVTIGRIIWLGALLCLTSFASVALLETTTWAWVHLFLARWGIGLFLVGRGVGYFSVGRGAGLVLVG